jgi:hypothetical protein
MATRKRYTPEQVVRKLTQADQLLAEGKDVADACRELQVTEATYERVAAVGERFLVLVRPNECGIRRNVVTAVGGRQHNG